MNKLRSLVFRLGDRGYVYRDTLYYAKVDVKTKGEVIGYVEEDGKKRGIIFDVTRIREARDLKFVGFLKEIRMALLEDGKGNVYVWQPNEEVKEGIFDVVEGVPLRKNDTKILMENMQRGESFIRYAVSRSQDKTILREALRRSKDCDYVLELFAELEEYGREEALAAANCMELKGMVREALNIYQRFDQRKAAELRDKLVKESRELLSSGDLKKMIRAAELSPDSEPPFRLGLELWKRGRVKEAIQYLTEALRREDSMRNSVTLAWMMIKAGMEVEALKLLEKIEQERRTPGVAYMKGIILEKSSPSRAEREFAFACMEGISEACMKNFTIDDELEGVTLYGYHLKKLVGDGGMGKVYLAERRGKKYAVKVMKRESRHSEVLGEVAKLQQLSQHPNIMKIIGSYVDEEYDPRFPPAIVTEFMEGGDLTNVLVSKEYSSLRSSLVWTNVVAQIFKSQAAALIHLHMNGYVHCDFKPSNILFDSWLPPYGMEALNAISSGKVRPKLSDLGSAVKIGEVVLHYTPFYAHPIQRFGARADTSLDVYSFGVSIYVALTGKYPTPDWLEREMEQAAAGSVDREEVLKNFHRVEPDLTQVHPGLRNVVYGALKQEMSMEEIYRELRAFCEMEVSLVRGEMDRVSSGAI